MITSQCAICGEQASGDLLYPERLPRNAWSTNTFSARRAPDRVHPRIMRCRACRLIYADQLLESHELSALYRDSHLTYEAEIPYLRRTYGRYLRRLERFAAVRGRFLEVGCGNGFMLEEALAQGYREVAGVEPSLEAVAQASPLVRGQIRPETFDARRFPPASFDVVCAFHLFDHLSAPQEFLTGARHLLRSGGALLLILHDTAAWSAKLFGERSPIFDVAHPYLYDRRTLATLLGRYGFRVQESFAVWNSYPLQYLGQLVPLPRALKRPVGRLLEGMGIGQWSATLPIGNFGVIAQPTP